jgi:hypothetical protein
MPKTGIIHAHSQFSFDGEHRLEELATLARRRGFDFIAMTEHSDTLDTGQMQQFVRTCRQLSDSQFLVMPGVEFDCAHNLHMLGIGIEDLVDSKDPTFVARAIREQGGLAIIAHPSRSAYLIPEGLENVINGIEVWNARYDGWFIPNDRAIALWRALRQRNTTLIAIGGQDLHVMTRHGYVKTAVVHDQLNQAALLQALEDGRFWISNSYLRLHSTSFNGWFRSGCLACARQVYLCARSVGRPIKRRLQAKRGISSGKT